MICPECGEDSWVLDVVFVEKSNMKYRKRKCLECSNVFYTRENLIAFEELPSRDWKENHRQYVSKKRKKSKARNSRVRCIDTGKVYDSIISAAKETGLSRVGISYCCTGKRYSCGGLRWEYYE